MGSKARIIKYILPFLLEDKEKYQYYIEPFCGGCNSICKVKGIKRIASDINPYLIALWKGLQNGEKYKYRENITKEIYNEARNEYNNRINNKYSNFELGWIGYMASFNGRFFDGGYSGIYKGRNYIEEQIRNVNKQIPYIKDILFLNQSYLNFKNIENSIIYCDPPYKGTKQYMYSKDFDYNIFWEWCRQMHKRGNKIFISEYNAPSDFICIWEKEVKTFINAKKTLHPIEKLFIL